MSCTHRARLGIDAPKSAGDSYLWVPHVVASICVVHTVGDILYPRQPIRARTKSPEGCRQRARWLVRTVEDCSPFVIALPWNLRSVIVCEGFRESRRGRELRDLLCRGSSFPCRQASARRVSGTFGRTDCVHSREQYAVTGLAFDPVHRHRGVPLRVLARPLAVRPLLAPSPLVEPRHGLERLSTRQRVGARHRSLAIARASGQGGNCGCARESVALTKPPSPSPTDFSSYTAVTCHEDGPP